MEKPRLTLAPAVKCLTSSFSAKATVSRGNDYPLCSVGTEQPCVVSLLHHDVGYSRLVILLQADAGFPNG